MADLFTREHAISDGPFLDVVTSHDGVRLASGLWPRMQTDGHGEGWTHEFGHNRWQPSWTGWARIVRAPDGKEQIFQQFGQTFVEPVAPGRFARWILYPPQDAQLLGKHEWVLWRYEGPGLIENVAPVEWVLGAFSSANRRWIWDSYHAGPRSVPGPEGRIAWVDGGGIPYGAEWPYSDGKGPAAWEPARLASTSPWYWFNANPVSLDDWDTAPIPVSDLVDDKRGEEWRAGDHPGVWSRYKFGRTYWSALDGLRWTDEAIRALRPSKVVELYYGLGGWKMPDDWNGGNSRCPVYVSDRWGGKHSTVAAFVEYTLRDRIYDLRPDLHSIKLADGSTIPGLIDYRTFPPLDGLACELKGTTASAIGSAVFTVASLLPGIGIWVSIAQMSAQLQNTLEAMETQGKVAAWVHDLKTGKTTLEAIDAATTPAPAPNPTKGAGTVLLVALAAAAVVVAAA